MSFADQLKLARISMGLTQQEVADLMGITNSTYCGYETGKRQPDVAKIKHLAKILNTSGDFLLETGHENAPSPSEDDEEALSVDEVISAFVSAGLVPEGKDLSDEDLRFLESMIAAIERWFAD